MGRAFEFGIIVVSLLVPSLVIGQGFQPLSFQPSNQLSYTTSYKVINGQLYVDPPTTPAPTFLERWFPFLAPLPSVNSEAVDEEIINSVSGPSPPDSPPYGDPNLNAGGVLSLPGFSSYQNPGNDLNQMQSPYLMGDEDNYISSESVNVPQHGPLVEANSPQQQFGPPQGNYVQQPASMLLNYVQQPSTSGNHPEQPQLPLTFPPLTNSNNYDYPNKQQFYGGNPYPKPFIPLPPYQVPQEVTTESPPFYQGVLDFFGLGSTTTESPLTSVFSSGPFQFPQNFIQARKSDEDEPSIEENEEPKLTKPDDGGSPSADKDKETSSPCPKLGNWQWNGEACIAVGPVPAWGCKPNDMIQSGRLTICRNKIFFPFGLNQHEN